MHTKHFKVATLLPGLSPTIPSIPAPGGDEQKRTLAMRLYKELDFFPLVFSMKV